MRIDTLSLFPAVVETLTAASILGRAQEAGCVRFFAHDLRDYTADKHRTVDDRPFGGGPGMILKCEPLVHAIESIRAMESSPATVICMTPQGERLTQKKAAELSLLPRLILVSGHYEGIDQRVLDGGWIDQELSIGDYVLTSGILPALVVADAVVRLLPGALGNEASALQESFSQNPEWLEGPQYTRPEVFRELAVPGILLSGHHAEITAWRHEQASKRTQLRMRSDLAEEASPKLEC